MIIDGKVNPDFNLVSFTTLPSLFEYSATVDSDHLNKGGSLKDLPSRNRKIYGFMFDKLNPKLL